VEHQVYSPTHGYAWLNFESGGHLTFTRKIILRPSPGFITSHSVNQAEMRPTARMDGRNYTYYDSGNRQIEFAEGEFNWRPKAGEVSSSVSLASGDLMLTYVQAPSEREIEQTRYVDPEAVYASAGVSPKWRRGIHILQEYKPTAGEALRSVVAGACAVLCFVLSGAFSSNEAQVLKRQEASFQQFPVETAFKVTQPDALVRVSIWSNVNNSWAEFDVELEDPEDEVLFETSWGVEFYQGYDGGSWSEGSTTTTLTFMPTVAGQYTLTFSSPVSQVDWKGGRPANHLRFSVFENVYPTFWLSYAALVLIILAAIPVLRRLLHQRRRWSGPDWEDDE